VDVVAGDRQPVAAQQDVDLQPLPQRVEDAVADRRQLGRDVVRDIERLLRQASFSVMSWREGAVLRRLPSRRRGLCPRLRLDVDA
jgi:hypothetical protein